MFIVYVITNGNNLTDLLIDLLQTSLVAADIAQVELYSMNQLGYMLEDNPYGDLEMIWLDIRYFLLQFNAECNDHQLIS